VRRRAFLRLSAVAAGTAACSRHAGPAAPPAGTAAPTGGPATTAPATTAPVTAPATTAAAGGPTAADWTALGRGLAGRLVRPDDAGYPAAKQLFDPRHDSIRPAGIAYCANPADVRECIRFAGRFAVPVTARAGGHSYAGWSTGTGLVIDVTSMRRLATDGDTVTVGAGIRHADFYAGLAGHGVAVPGGSCPTVGLGGLVLGGGVGVVSRAYGLTSDNLVGVQVVTADGRIRDCSAGQEPDLFWACRGGGGGNFGVATSFRLRTRPAPTVSLFYLAWPWSRAARVVQAWQGWAPNAPDPLWSTCKLLAGGGREAPSVFAAGTYLGSAADAQPLLDQLVARVGADPISHSLRTQGYLAAMLTEAGCAGRTVTECHLPGQLAGGRLSRESEVAASHFFGRPVPAAGLAAMVAGVVARGGIGGGGEGGISMDALGGAVNRIAPGATAFVHRDSLFLAQLTSTWAAGAAPGAVADQQRWLTGFRDTLAPYANGEAYQNYIDPTRSDWRRAYYGANYTRLARVKAALDPGSLFRLPQGVTAH
jgi:FAD/FMN-containing dehydrogenase